MTAADVIHVCRAAPQARVIIVHMEAINHCRLTRRELANAASQAGLAQPILIPQDGETISC
jgi:hypothetical protein